MFASLRDAVSDHCGRRVIVKHAGLPLLAEIDYLLRSPDYRAGALGFGKDSKPPVPIRKFNRLHDLENLLALVDSVHDEKEVPDSPDTVEIVNLPPICTAMGGARPKAVVEDAAALWLAKFNDRDDRWNHTRIEHAMLELAKSCGFSSTHSRVETVADPDVLLVKRFDRE